MSLTLTDAEVARIKSFIGKKLATPRNELEARFFPPIRGNPERVDHYQFNRILARYTYKKENGGYGLRKETYTRLAVTSERIPELREIIETEDAVKLLWLTEDIKLVKTKAPDHTYRMIKKKVEHTDLSNYAVRISLGDEQPLSSEAEKFQFFSNESFPKDFRLHNRISVFTEDNLFRIDFTSVKSGVGRTFKKSKVLSNYPSYEIELEFIGDSSASKQVIFDRLIQHIGNLLSIYYESPLIITRDMRQKVGEQYQLLVRNSDKLRRSNRGKTELRSFDFIAANPVTLHRENLIDDPKTPNILSNYGVTFKADGERFLLYVLSSPDEDENGSIYLFNSNFQVLPVGVSLPAWANTVIEGEYIRELNSFYGYDALFAKGLDIRNKGLKSFSNDTSSRLQYLKDFIKDLNASVDATKENAPRMVIHIYEKPYEFGNKEAIFSKSDQLLKAVENQPFHVDGLIYAPATEPYPSVPMSWDRLFKWKPPHLNTIDFLIETVKGENKRDKLFPYVKIESMDQRANNTSPSAVSQYKIVKLYVSGMIETFNRRSNKVQRRRGPVLFREAKIPVNTNGKMIARDPLSGSIGEVTDDTIVEFSYNKDSDFPWTPIRVRYDKTAKYKTNRSVFGNAEHVARDIWRSIQVPVTKKMVTTGEVPPPSSENSVRYTKEQLGKETKSRLPYQVFHTVYVKKRLLEEVALNPRDPERGAGFLIDFGSSRGGDLNRWREIGFERVIGLDIDPDSVLQASLRYESMNVNRDHFQVDFLCADLTRTIFPNYNAACDTSSHESHAEPIVWKDELKINIPQKYMFDVVSSQFVIHYSFKDEKSVRSYFQNVTDNLRVGGYFVGSTFDGNRVYEALKRKKSIEGTKGKDIIWEIKKLYGSKKFSEDKPNFGMSIEVFVKSIGIPHVEYMVSFPYLEKIASEYGLELVKITPFEKLWEEGVEKSSISGAIKSMTPDEKQFSFFNSAFLFKKTRHASDEVYRRLVKLQGKK